MLRVAVALLHRGRGRGRGRGGRVGAANTHVTQTNLSMLDIFVQLQLGISISPSVQRGFLLQNCREELERRGLERGKVVAMDTKHLQLLVKDIALQHYLSSVPFRVFGFDIEFTGPPAFRADGPTEDVMELGLYSPGRDALFSCLVKPVNKRPIQEEVVTLTGITGQMIQKAGLPFPKAWAKLMKFVQTPDPGEVPGAGDRILLLSHGGKLADQSLIKYTLEKCGLELPPSIVFGDTIHIVRDAHRRRPVTVDRHPPSWGLSDLVSWLKIAPTLPAHRAGNDAKMTWDVLYHTLLRYGDDDLTPKQQLVSRFFDEAAKKSMRQIKSGAMLEGSGSTTAQGGKVRRAPMGDEGTLSREESESLLLDTDFDEIFDEGGDGSDKGKKEEKMIVKSRLV